MVEGDSDDELFTLQLTVLKVPEQHTLKEGDVLVIDKNGLQGAEGGNKVFFGKDETCQVRFKNEDSTIFSKLQAVIYYSDTEDGFVIRCLSDTVPTRIRVQPGKKYVLNESDWILLGFNWGFEITKVGPIKSTAAEKGLIVNPRQNENQATGKLRDYQWKEKPNIEFKWNGGPPELVNGKGGTKRWPEKEKKTDLVFGRVEDKANYCLSYPDSEINAELSRRHCRIDYDPTIGWYITEDGEGSMNGTFFCIKQYVYAHTEGKNNVLIEDGLEIYMGDTAFKVHTLYIIYI